MKLNSSHLSVPETLCRGAAPAAPCLSEPFAICLVDPESGRILEANDAAARCWDCDGLPGMTLDAVCTLGAAETKSVLAQFMAGRAEGLECRLRRADGAERHALLHGRPAQRGDCSLIQLAFFDITRYKRGLDARVSHVLNASPDAMLMADAGGSIRFANHAAHAVFGYGDGELIGHGVDQLVPAALRGQHERQRAVYQEQPRARPMSEKKSLVGVRRDGSEFPLEISLMPMSLDGCHATIAVVQDITERKQAEDRLTASERRWKFALEGAGDGVWDWNLATDEVYYSPRFAALLGDLDFGHSYACWMRRIHPDDRHRMQQELDAYFSGKRQNFLVELRMQTRDRGWRWMLARGMVAAWDGDGRGQRMIGTLCDISERKESEEALQLAAMVYQHSAEAMMVTDADNVIVAVNPAFTTLTGYSAIEAIGRNPSMLRSGKQDKAFYEAMWDSLKNTGSWRGRIHNRRKNGDELVEQVTINTIRNEDGEICRYVALFADITEKTRFDERMWRQANFDTLTQLPNRRMSLDRLEHDIMRARRTDKAIALLFIDIDNFKEVNDTFGHQMGDALLVEASHRIMSCVRSTDTVARFGGDEFTIVMSDLDETERVQEVAQQIIARLSAPFKLADEKLYTSASIGITLFPNDAHDAETLLKNADQAMYEAKSSGRNRYCFFTHSMLETTQTRVMLARDMREAIEHENFEIYFQPIVDLNSNRIVKAEALLRWQHPTRGMISPVVFIPIAEANGLIVPLSNWMFREVAKMARRWRELASSPIQFSINVSPAQFHGDSEMPECWIDTCREYAIPGETIVLEITEGLLLKANDDVGGKLRALHQAGIQIALDDFGTGYSSLSYLKKFDIDFIKIDKSFVRDLETDPNDLVLSEAIVVMAHKLGLKVIAEGIESAGQKALLAAAGCDYGQGYLYAKPMPAAAFENLLREARAAEEAASAIEKAHR
ncbi:PAS domain S-box-containing protein/diguanylate cyclase (GGDEF) domain-containing protein [Noviherbaspirillum humi]|uniref:PAS domain S-box-containing protein/diguanylate cyclase (GGDEF) domain-containing protein n=1 Tax=Noviherbaspirillum humi TaxID=1688639 RepID=A0A239ITN1_9BURK|nr:EAL domain-containing protein [Noviherbaspirillum humi]SNS97126.1 PAS domain S-box-containing protein/diguanylate cyclase (GGDEF) domain-containing protein [Noviherbaspirillum humi]